MIKILNRNISSFQVIIFGFASVILAGSLLLTLPVSTIDRQGASFADALFTATSAVCVTGLVIHDTATYWSAFGQAVIISLIQIGGMGVVTVAAAISMLAGRRIGLMQRSTMQESLAAPQVGGIVRLTSFILKTTFIIELAGAAVMAPVFCREFGVGKGIWYAVFHSVSAFCNAGFDLMGAKGSPFASLTDYRADALVSLTAILLILIGGIGFGTWKDFRDKRLHLRRFSLQSKLVLSTTLVLVGGGFLFMFLYEFRLPQWQSLGLGERALAALFQTVTPRTAGFNTVDLTALSPGGKLVTLALMLIGGASGSTAGGFKMTTVAVLLLCIASAFRGKDSTNAFGRRIPDQAVQNAAAIFILYLLLFLASGIFISCYEQLPLMSALFETASAIATVGLSLGITAQLSTVSHIILILLMFFGRVGGLTLIYAVASGDGADGARLPQERVAVG